MAGTVAAAPVTTTASAHGLVDTVVDLVPTCDNSAPVLYRSTTTSNAVEHDTVFADGRAHATYTQVGTFVAVQLSDPSPPSYTGRFTTSAGFDRNTDSVIFSTDTFSIHGTGSDGSTVSVQRSRTLHQRPEGSVNEFFHRQ